MDQDLLLAHGRTLLLFIHGLLGLLLLLWVLLLLLWVLLLLAQTLEGAEYLGGGLGLLSSGVFEDANSELWLFYLRHCKKYVGGAPGGVILEGTSIIPVSFESMGVDEQVVNGACAPQFADLSAVAPSVVPRAAVNVCNIHDSTVRCVDHPLSGVGLSPESRVANSVSSAALRGESAIQSIAMLANTVFTSTASVVPIDYFVHHIRPLLNEHRVSLAELGALSCGTYNLPGLCGDLIFTNPQQHHLKQRACEKLILSHNILCLQEVHCDGYRSTKKVGHFTSSTCITLSYKS